MDLTALVFYAVVCGLLGFAAPWLGSPAVRLALGAAVGIVAAMVLPFLKAMVGGS